MYLHIYDDEDNERENDDIVEILRHNFDTFKNLCIEWVENLPSYEETEEIINYFNSIKFNINDSISKIYQKFFIKIIWFNDNTDEYFLNFLENKNYLKQLKLVLVNSSGIIED